MNSSILYNLTEFAVIVNFSILLTFAASSHVKVLSELAYAGFLACSPDSYISRCRHSLSAHVSLEDTVIGSYRGVRATNQTGKKEWVLAVDGRVK